MYRAASQLPGAGTLQDLLSDKYRRDPMLSRVESSWPWPVAGCYDTEEGDMCSRSEWGVCSGDAAGHPKEVLTQ